MPNQVNLSNCMVSLSNCMVSLSNHRLRSLPPAWDALGTKEPTLPWPQSKVSAVIRLFPSPVAFLYHDSWRIRPPVPRGPGPGPPAKFNRAKRENMNGEGNKKFTRRSARKSLRLPPGCEPLHYHLSALLRMHPKPVEGTEPAHGPFVLCDVLCDRVRFTESLFVSGGNEWSRPTSLPIVESP